MHHGPRHWARWRIEEDLETTKDLGLDHYEGRTSVGWYRHITLVLLASAFLVSICVQDGLQPVRAPQQDEVISPLAPALIALTPSEVQHLLARLIWPLPASVPLVCGWSRFRASEDLDAEAQAAGRAREPLPPPARDAGRQGAEETNDVKRLISPLRGRRRRGQ